ncbi:MAG TPA: ABC transporter permease [Bdellovibrionales bacterium]|nr:ABC transporter permease [Bdellovibrionales bacterium]
MNTGDRIEELVNEGALGILEIARGIIQSVGFFSMFVWESILWWFRPPYRFSEMIKHMEFIGNKSVFIICLTGLFTGMVFAFQVYQGFKIVNAGNLVGPTAALAITRELGPVLTGLIVAARAGGAMAAQLGTMRVTEQIDALDVMGVNPKQYLVAPRIVAAVICLPLLAAVFDYVALLGSYVVGVHLVGLEEAVFLDKTYYFLEPRDIYQGLFKAGVFGVIFSTICTFKGFFTRGGARGVGLATNEGVVLSMVLIIVSDFFVTNLLTIFLRIIR